MQFYTGLQRLISLCKKGLQNVTKEDVTYIPRAYEWGAISGVDRMLGFQIHTL